MRGHENIIRLRMSGKIPSIVFLNDYPCDVDWFETGSHATVEIQPADAPELLDLRFVKGLTVSATGSTEKRAKAIFEACKQAGAKTVACCHAWVEKSPEWGTMRAKSGWSEIWKS